MFDHNNDFTNGEKCANVYLGSGNPTIPSLVTPETSLEDLNLNWTEKDLPEKVRTKHVHRLHPYLGKFIPQLVEIFLRKYFKPGMTVLDPFAGSGTTLVQANELGINSIGYDISAFNVLLMRAKTQKYDIDLVEREILDILNKVDSIANKNQSVMANLFPDTANDVIITDDNEYLKLWFAPQARKELLIYRELIKNYQNQDILKVILSRSARSARLTTHYDLDFPKEPQIGPYWCHKHRRTCTPTTTAYQFLRQYSLDTIKRLKEFALCRTDATVEIIHGDSQVADIPVVDGLITSPPYVGLIDYHDQHRYAYELLGLEDNSSFEIGAAKEGTSQQAKIKYQQAIANVFKRCCESIRPGGYLIVIACDKHNLYGKIAELCGVKEEAILQRQVNRRTGRRSTDFYESVFIWQRL
ncbi:MAG TPA: DNA methyltransferase [Syntrophomonadaceae bacterium]|nr:DNA methyltransferase [Syntrophomonadaceae bacterium]